MDVNVIVKNKLRAFSHLEFLMSLHVQAMYIFWNQPFFLFSQKEIAFVYVYIRQANFTTNLAELLLHLLSVLRVINRGKSNFQFHKKGKKGVEICSLTNSIRAIEKNNKKI